MSSDNILVAIKSRPFISREKSEKLGPQWSVQEKVIFQVDEDGHRLGEPYSFDHIFTEHTTNASVYNAVVEPLVKSFLNGFNSTIFAYGQTSSGKTYTMMGTDDSPGIIQLAINDVFQHVLDNNSQRRYLISCSYFEIYNEKINDLLDKNGQDLKIREDYCGNTFVNAKEEVVTEQTQVFELMKTGGKIRKIGCTNMNERSSRSHTIFRFTIKSTENNIEHGPVQISHLNLVDLAGSERIAHTKAAGVRLKEGVNINKSLLALGNVIRQLSEGEGFINYRDSNLTRLLQHALGGNAKSLIIATITIAAGEETKSTLEFAQRAKVVKNKPIINEILSEQVKIKQYELATASYKERLKKEQRRIQEMEQEKEEREREISRLKQQVKLIDLFTNGPEIKQSESKIPRRHTMGHYTTRIPLQTIPESRVWSSNIMPEKHAGHGRKCDEEDDDDDELLFKSISQVSDYDYMKMTLEKSLEDGILAVTPEPSEELLIQEETTPASHLRERLKHLEESYMSLQEFTKLEAECKDDKDTLCELTKEKENLLKDVIDLNAIIKEVRQENEKLKMKFETEYSVLQNDLAIQKKKANELAFTLEQAEAEKDVLRLAKEQLLIDNEFVLEQQKRKYEKQIQYCVDEIERLNKRERESDVVDYNFEDEIKKLKKENENLKLNVEKITTYEEKIVQLEEKLEQYEKKEEEDSDVLSVSTQTEDIKETPNAREEMKTELQDITNETIIQKECDELKDNIQKLKDKLENVQSINIKLEEELGICKLKASSYLEKENTDNVQKDVSQKQEEINALRTKLSNLENENQSYMNTIDSQKEEIHLKDEKISELTNKLVDFEKDIQNNEEKVKAILDQSKKLEDDRQNQTIQFNQQIEAMKSKDESIDSLNNKIKHFEKLKQDLEGEVSLYKEQIQLKDAEISDLTSKVISLEDEHKCCKEEINAYKIELDSKTMEVKSQVEKVNQELETSAIKVQEQEKIINDMEKEIEVKIKTLEDQLKKLQTENKIYEQEIANFKKEIIYKEDEIIVLKSKLDAVQLEQTSNVEDLVIYQKELEAKCHGLSVLENKLVKLDKDNDNYKQEICFLKQDLTSKENKLAVLTEKIDVLEMDNERFMREVCNKENLMQQVEYYKEENAIISENNGILNEELLIRNEAIAGLNTTVTNLEKINYSNNAEIEFLGDRILKLTEKITCLENEISCKEQTIIELEDKMRNFELSMQTETDLHARQIQDKENLLLELNNMIKDLEKCSGDKNEIETRDNRISELTNIITDLENEKEKDVHIRDKKISELINKVNHLEDLINLDEKDIHLRDNQISLLQNKLQDLEISIRNSKDEIKSRDDQIVELTHKITCLEDDKHKQEEIKTKDMQISDLQGEIEDLRVVHHSKDEEIIQLSNAVQNFDDEIINLKNDILSKEDIIAKLRAKVEKLDEDCHHYEDEVSQCKEEIFLQERKIKDLIECNASKEVQHKNAEDYKKEDNIHDLNRRIYILTSDKKKLEQLLGEVSIEKEKEKIKTRELENRIRNSYMECVGLRTRIFDLENVITELKSGALSKKFESLPSHHSSTSSTELSPKEVRRRKRQSIHDQRRGLDLSACGNDSEAQADASTIQADLKAKIKRLKSTIDHLSQENESLEFEVQGFIRELDDYKKYNEEKDKEIEMLTEQIEELKKATCLEGCNECSQKQNHIKKLEELQKQNKFKIVELQTKYYDLQNKMKEEATNAEEKERILLYQIRKLETRFGAASQPELKNAEVQCDIMNLQQLLEKYNKVKKLARMRREEANILRSRLGMESDEPAT